MVLDFGPRALIRVDARSLTTALALVQVGQLVFVDFIGKNRVGRACSGEVRIGSGATGKSAATPAATLSSIEARTEMMRRLRLG